MENSLMEKLKSKIDETANPNAQKILIELDYHELAHLYALEGANVVYTETLHNQIMDSFEKVKSL